MACFTIIFGFMAELLHLEGYAKQIYAVIFGYWIRSRKSVSVPYSVIRKITGATDPTISTCIKKLVEVGLVAAVPKTGQRTKYDIIITDEIWAAYLRDSGQDETTKKTEELYPVKDTTKVFHRTTKPPKEHKERIENIRRDSAPTSNLVVPSANCVSSRVKTIKIEHTS